jgi:GT2 family glycosyltransferase
MRAQRSRGRLRRVCASGLSASPGSRACAQRRDRRLPRRYSRLHGLRLPSRPRLVGTRLAALSNVDADLVGGRVEVDVGDPAHPTAVEAFEIVFAFNLKRYVERLGFSAAANMFVPREIFDRVGPFRARVTEDLEWGKRASAANYRWRYAANVVVTHPARRTWAELWRKWRRRSEEDFELALEHPRGRVIWLLRSSPLIASKSSAIACIA